MNAFITRHRISASLLLCALFAGAFYQAPLFSANQNTYFLQGLAHSGYGHLSRDWLANQTDHIPLFSSMVALIHATGHDWIFHAVFLLLAVIYAASLTAIAACIHGDKWQPLHTAIFLCLLTLLHCSWVLIPLAEPFPVLHAVISLFQKIAFACTNGVAGQSILGPFLQPSTFGIFILAGVACILYRREFAGIGCAILAAAMHPTFILHAGILTAACLFILISEQRTRTVAPLAAFASLLIAPVLLHLAPVLQSAGTIQLASAQAILVEERIPHHAKLLQWFSATTVLKIAIIAAGTALSFRSKRLFLLLAICTGSSVVLSILQLASGSTSLALMFPWRLSTWLVPACLAILLGYFAVMINCAWESWLAPVAARRLQTTAVGVSITFVAFSSLQGILKTLDSVLAPQRNDAALYAKTHALSDQTYLIPLQYERFRLEAGVPVFVEWKSHPYRDTEVIEWHDRTQLARAFYGAQDSETAARALAAIQAHAAVSHIIVEAGKEYLLGALHVEPLFQDDKDVLVRLR